MNLPVAIAWLLAAAVGIASARTLWRLRSGGTRLRPQVWRLGFLLLAQAASAALLYFTLFPPPLERRGGVLTVLTADAARTGRGAGTQGVLVALPEAVAPGARWLGAERVPDLATALRRHPGTRRIDVVGAGLTARDIDAARGRALAFQPAPPPAGLDQLQPPTRVAAGRRFQVGGHASDLSGGSAELRDPAGRRSQRVALDQAGNFRLQGTASSAGLATYRVRLYDGRGLQVEDAPLPVQVEPPRRLRALVLGGAPNAELKFLRRWALDAGIALDTRIELGGGMQIASPRAALNSASLARFDLLIVDERSWRGLGAGQRAQVLSAVEGGLGLLLRMSAGSGSGDRQSLTALGFRASASPQRDTRLGTGFARAGDAADALPTLTRSPLRLAADDAIVALADAAGHPLALWRARGRGRVGVAAFDDSFRLVLGGRSDAHGEVWSRLATVLARPLPSTPPHPIRAAPPRLRSTVCAAGPQARVRAPDGSTTALRVDPHTGAEHCAGFWARVAGWHRVQDGERSTAFFVPRADAMPALTARRLREATASLAGDASVSPTAAEPITGPRWPWFIAWLLLTAAMWWLERSRHGLRTAA